MVLCQTGQTMGTARFIHLNQVAVKSSLLWLDVEKHIASVRIISPGAYSFETCLLLGRIEVLRCVQTKQHSGSWCRLCSKESKALLPMGAANGLVMPNES